MEPYRVLVCIEVLRLEQPSRRNRDLILGFSAGRAPPRAAEPKTSMRRMGCRSQKGRNRPSNRLNESGWSIRCTRQFHACGGGAIKCGGLDPYRRLYLAMRADRQAAPVLIRPGRRRRHRRGAAARQTYPSAAARTRERNRAIRVAAAVASPMASPIHTPTAPQPAAKPSTAASGSATTQ